MVYIIIYSHPRVSNPAIQTGEMKNCFHRGKDKGSFGLGVLSHLSQEYNSPDLKSNKVGILEAGGLIVEYLTSLLCSCFLFCFVFLLCVVLFFASFVSFCHQNYSNMFWKRS